MPVRAMPTPRLERSLRNSPNWDWKRIPSWSCGVTTDFTSVISVSWTKHTNYEQANRIPLIFAGPGISRGAVTEQLASSVDVFPTPGGPGRVAGTSRPATHRWRFPRSRSQRSGRKGQGSRLPCLSQTEDGPGHPNEAISTCGMENTRRIGRQCRTGTLRLSQRPTGNPKPGLRETGNCRETQANPAGVPRSIFKKQEDHSLSNREKTPHDHGGSQQSKKRRACRGGGAVSGWKSTWICDSLHRREEPALTCVSMGRSPGLRQRIRFPATRS